MIQQPYPLSLVSIAASEDTALLTQWETHLQPLQQAVLITVWSEVHLAPGANRVQEIQRHVDDAHILVLLLSSDFFASPDCLAMMEQAVQRSRAGATRIIPIRLRPVAWQESPLAELAHWPSNGVAITQWSDQDTAWNACVQKLRHLLGRRISEALPSESSVQHVDPDWDRMLRRLRLSYQELLDQSLHGIAWIELDLATRPDLISNVTNLLYHFPDGGEQLLEPGTSILDAFDTAVGELLILGTPGAGKSTLLLDLARQLVGRAFVDPFHPLPVVLRLSSWALRRPALVDWMIEQLSNTYNVPRVLSEHWVTQGRLLPLFDGLDEMEEAARPACIAAINTYHRIHLVPIVVCSRQNEYEATARRERLVLQGAVIIQALSEIQIEGYLTSAGPAFTGVRTAFHQEHALRELATTPLMLSVLLLTYRGATASEIIQQGNEMEGQVWTDYVARQVTEKGSNTRYSLKRTRAFLSWLARQMQAHQQTIFSAEYLQDNWLAHDQQQMVRWLATRLPALVLGGSIGVLVFLLIGRLTDLVSALQFGLVGAFVGSRLNQLAAAEPMSVRSRRFANTLMHFRNALLLGLLVAASNGFYLHSANPRTSDPGYFLLDWLRDGCILGLGSLLSGWRFQVLLERTPKQWVPVLHTPLGLRDRLASRMNTMGPLYLWQAAFVFGGGMGLSYGLSYGLDSGLSYGLSYGLAVWLMISVIVVLAHVILAGTVGSLRFAERIHWTWRGLLQPRHLRTSLIIAGMLLLFFVLSDELSLGLYYALYGGPGNGLSYGLSQGLSTGLTYGLSNGLSTGLTYWILLGLYQGMKQEHLEDQGRQRFNQGIRRSLRNGLLIGLISAFIISAVGVLSYGLNAGLSRLNAGLSYGLSQGMSYGLTYGLTYGLSSLFLGTVVMWAISGGLTILRHYVIRWLLARHHTFPFRAQAFLDDATTRILLRRVGGGYSFIHRRLQDYFADAAVPPFEN